MENLNLWISVKTELPKYEEKVFITDNDDLYCVGCYTKRGWGIYSNVYFEPTYWMSIPLIN